MLRFIGLNLNLTNEAATECSESASEQRPFLLFPPQVPIVSLVERRLGFPTVFQGGRRVCLPSPSTSKWLSY